MDESELNDMFGGSDAAGLEILNNLSSEFARATDEARCYFDTLEQLLSQELEKEVLNFQKISQELNDAQQDHLFETSILPYWEDIFDYNLKSSFVISLFSMLEVYLEKVCKAVDLVRNTGVVLENSNGNFLDKKKKFLCACIGTSVKSLDWHTMHQIYTIRNKFTHTQGSCSKPTLKPNEKPKRLRKRLKQFNTLEQFIEGTDGISIRHEWIQIDPAFCKSTLLAVWEFGRDLGHIIRDYLTNQGS